MSNKRVVVTGLGVLTPLGLGLKQNWANVLAGRSSVTKLESNGSNLYLKPQLQFQSL